VAPDAPNTLTPEEAQALLERADEVGQMARLYRHLALRAAEAEPAQ
jgi:hypothetical protein